MDTTLMLCWVKEIWLPYTRGRESLLVFDHFCAHLVDEVNSSLREGKSITSLIPGGCTSVLQPLHVSLNKPFKSHIRREWLKFMEDGIAMQEDEQDGEGYLSDDPLASSNESEDEAEDTAADEISKLLTKSRTKKMFAVKPASKQILINWTERAWRKVKKKPEMVAKSFVVTGISQHLGEEDTTVRNGQVQEDIEAAYGADAENELDSNEDSDSS